MKNLFMPYWMSFIFILLFISCKEKSNCLSVLQRKNSQLENLKILSKLQHAGEGEILKDIYIYKVQDDSICFSQLLNDFDNIVFFFSEYSCSSCYIPFMKKITEKYEELKDKVIIVAGFENKRDFKIYMEDKNFPFTIYRTRKNFSIFPEYNDYPLAFLTNKNMVIDNLMIIDQSNKEHIDDYLSIISKKAMQNSK